VFNEKLIWVLVLQEYVLVIFPFEGEIEGEWDHILINWNCCMIYRPRIIVFYVEWKGILDLGILDLGILCFDV